MRGLSTSLALLVGLAMAQPAAAASALRNVTGFDAAALAGKTCQGTFNSGRKGDASKGAVQLRFAITGDALGAHLWRRLGQAAYEKAAYAITQPALQIDASGFDDLGEVRGLSVAGTVVQYVDSQGARVQLTYDRGRLRGQSDPTGQSIPGMTRVAFVTMICR